MIYLKYFLLVFASIIGGLVGLFALFILFFIVISLFFDHTKNYTKDNKFYRAVFNFATGLVLFAMRIRITTEGFDKFPKEKFLLVGNHVSNLDPIVTWYAMRKIEDISFISKPSNIAIPFFGWVSRRICFLPIDTKNARRSVETIETAAEIIASGELSMGVYPEGRRNKDGVLGKFHNSVFKIATKTDCPIVVVRADGTNTWRKCFPLKTTEIKLTVVDIITKEEVAGMKTAEIGERVFDKILKGEAI